MGINYLKKSFHMEQAVLFVYLFNKKQCAIVDKLFAARDN